MGVEIGIVVGGGNFWRGRSNKYMDRATSDYIGMLGTTMNALAVGDAFKQLGQDVRVQTGVEMRQVAEFYIKDRGNGTVSIHSALNQLYCLGVCNFGTFNGTKIILWEYKEKGNNNNQKFK